MRGLYDGEYQLVAPWLFGITSVPSGVGCSTLLGRPFASHPSTQFTLVNGLPCRNCPFVRSSTYQKPLRFAHSISLRGCPCHGMSTSTGTCVAS